MKTKRFVSLLLSIVMLLGTWTVPAWAEETPEIFTLTIPYADENADNENDFSAEFGTLTNYFVYNYTAPETQTVSDAKEILTYPAANGTTYFYRVSNLLNADVVTYGDFVTFADDSAEAEVTLQDMMADDTDFNQDMVITDFSQNSYDTGDIFLNINEKGHLALATGDTYTLYPLRNWLPIEGISNKKVIEPDFHAKIIPLSGEDVISIAENTENTTAKHSLQITAQNSGAAIVIVTYDAVINNAAMGGSFLSAIRKENAGVFVVTVDQGNGIETNMTLNAGMNTTEKKLSGDAIDSEFDVLYYAGETGASYSFVPASGASVSLLRPDMTGADMTYTGEFEEITAQDGVFTLTNLYEGSHIVKIELNGKTEYQILRAKKTDYTVLVNGEEQSSPKPGDTVSIVFDKIYHPANKMSGVYNFTASIQYTLPDGSKAASTANQYKFATNIPSQTVQFTIPADYAEETYTLKNGAVVTGMWGSALGAHRSITYETGKPVNFTAVSNVSTLCSLPEITLTLADDTQKTVTVSAYAYTADRGVILDRYAVTVPADATAADCVQKAFAENEIPVEGLEDGYVSSIDGLGAGAGYSGWCLAYNNDDYANYGLSAITVQNGDALRFDYSMNVDTTTDDIGNGWYGNPVITAFSLGDTSLTMQKSVTFDASWNMQIAYTYSDLAKTPVSGAGTKENPYVLQAEADEMVSLDDITFTTTLNSHYLLSGEEPTDEENTILLYISSLGGTYKTWYKVQVTVNENQSSSGISSNKISVKFRLVGATKSTEDVDLSLGTAGYYGSEYKTWIATKTYSLSSNATVLDLIEKAANDAGISFDYDDGYISAVTAPKAYGGYTLSEMDNGANSGWMYTVNGKHPLAAIGQKILKNGDSVVFHYINDYQYEQSDLTSSATLGDGTLYNKWLKATDSAPSSTTSSISGAGSGASGGKTDSITAVIQDTAEYLYKTVENPTVGATGGEWAILGLARGGVDIPDEYYQRYYQNVENYVKNCNGILHEKKYTEYARVILALTAIGKNPADVAGFNLLTPLGDYEKIIWQGVNGPVWALIALDSGSYAVPQNPQAITQATRDLYIDYILDCQLANGGWALSKTETSPDPDLTAMALVALSKYQDRETVSAAIDKGIKALSALQNKNGGYTSYSTENSESTAQVLTAISALGISYTDSRFVKNGNTLVDTLLTYYTAGNGFRHAGTDSNLMATEQALYALVAANRLAQNQSALFNMQDYLQISNDTHAAGLLGKHADVSSMAVQFPGKTFADIQGHVNGAAIESLAARGIISGMTETTFCPDNTMTRAEFASMVVRALGVPQQAGAKFVDVQTTDWFYSFVNTAYYYGIVSGISETEFLPDGIITQEEAAAMVARAAKLCGMETSLSADASRDILAAFSDYVTVSDWATASLAFCYQENILDSSAMEIQPKTAVTRAEVAQMLYTMLGKAKLL